MGSVSAAPQRRRGGRTGTHGKMRICAPAGVLTFLLIGIIPGMRAGSLDSSTLALFPQNTSVLGYADLTEAQKLPWFPQFKQQVLPAAFRQLEDFLVSARIDPASQVKELAWALAPGAKDATAEGTGDSAKGGSSNTLSGNTSSGNTLSGNTLSGNTSSAGDEFIGIAIGQFDPDSTGAFLQQQKAASVEVKGVTLYACSSGAGSGDFFFAFIDSNTAVFGRRKGVERLLAVHNGEDASLLQNEAMQRLVRQVNGENVFWGVLDSKHAPNALRNLVPEMANFPETARIVHDMQALSIGIQASSTDKEIDAGFDAVSAAPADAIVLSQLLQAGLLFRRYQANQTDPDLAGMLGTVRIVPEGNDLKISLSLTNDQAIHLVEKQIFDGQF